MKTKIVTTVDVNLQPGYVIRRLHQIAVGIFHQETQSLDVTPVQYAILQMVYNQPGTDQRTLARNIALDTSTTARVVDRLEARGLLVRNASPDDRRVRLLTLTEPGEQLLEDTIPRMEQAQELILAPLNPEQRTAFMQLLSLLVTENNGLSRAPSDISTKFANNEDAATR
jgi:DNA-binding MarR family transcriptional regulator